MAPRPSDVDVDLDALCSPPITVRLAGQKWTVPGDMPLELFLKVNTFEQRLEEDGEEAELAEELADELLALFQVHHPDLEALPDGVSLTQAMQFVGAVYGRAAAADAEAGGTSGPPAKPPPQRRQRAAGGKRKTAPSAGEAVPPAAGS